MEQNSIRTTSFTLFYIILHNLPCSSAVSLGDRLSLKRELHRR